MTGITELIGQWSADCRYHPAAQSDEIIVFSHDKSGYFEFSNAAMRYTDDFTWDVVCPGFLQLNSSRLVIEEFDASLEQYAGKLHFDRLPYSIEMEDTPRGQIMNVLTLGEGKKVWTESFIEIRGIISAKFGKFH